MARHCTHMTAWVLVVCIILDGHSFRQGHGHKVLAAWEHAQPVADMAEQRAAGCMQGTDACGDETDMRELQQAADVTVVTSAEQLQSAVLAGDPYIEIQNHLDLTTLETVECDNDSCLLGLPSSGFIPDTVKSIRGNCKDVPAPKYTPAEGQEDMLPLGERQCLLQVDAGLLYLSGNRIWLDGLYVRLTTPRNGQFARFIEIGQPSGQLWMTRMTLQGNGDGEFDCYTCGLDLWSSSVYAEDCTFAHFDGQKVASAYWGGSVSLTNCAFVGNSLVNVDDLSQKNAAIVLADAGDEFKPNTNPDTAIRIEQCSFEGNSPVSLPTLLADDRGAISSTTRNTEAVFYGDSTAPSVCTFTGPTDQGAAACQNSRPKPLTAAAGRFLTASDPWFLELQQEHPLPPLAPAPPVVAIAPTPVNIPNVEGDGDSVTGTNGSPGTVLEEGDPPAPPPGIVDPEIKDRSGLPVGTIVGSTVGALIGVLAAIAALVLVSRRRKAQESKDANESTESKPPVESKDYPQKAASAYKKWFALGKKPTDEAAASFEHDKLKFSYRTLDSSNKPGVQPYSDKGVPPKDSALYYHSKDSHEVNAPAVHVTSYKEAPWQDMRQLSMASTDASSSNATPARTHPSSHANTVSSRTVGTASEATQLQTMSASGRSIPQQSRGMPPGLVTTGTTTTDARGDTLADLSTIGATTHAQPFQPRLEAPQQPAAGSSTEERLHYIKQQLDCFGPEHRLLGRYQLLGATARRKGGQAVVQFAAKSDGHSLEHVALKLFARKRDYLEESEVYRNSPLRFFMPTVLKYVSNDEGDVQDPFGAPMPPFIVMEKGESLQDRAANSGIDVFTAAQVFGQVSQRLAELHEARYVHRDLKPGNIMWQPRTYTWVLIDFGLAAAAGEECPMGLTPSYAAPETVVAFQSGARTVVADTAVDAWALGVIAFELLTQKPAFGAFCTREDVFAQLTGPGQLLPWEEGRISPQDGKRLGVFRKAILGLLERDPRKRATARQFCKACNSVFSTTMGGPTTKMTMTLREG